jgi:hypothetical protein
MQQSKKIGLGSMGNLGESSQYGGMQKWLKLRWKAREATFRESEHWGQMLCGEVQSASANQRFAWVIHLPVTW